MPDPGQVRSMFASIAGRYDLLNRVLSCGIDQRWRRHLLRRIGNLEGARVVDSCCGTGDLTLALEQRGASVIGVDFTPEMLHRARRKSARGGELFVHGDALQLPIADGEVDASTIAFGIRNVADRARGLAELVRVVRPGGTVCVLEFSMPPGRWLGALYRFYFTRVLPRIGGLISGSPEAYRYLPDTVLAWPSPDELASEMRASGLVDCGYQRLSGGIACLSFGTRPIRS